MVLDGFLREGEFRRWADGIDEMLGDIHTRVIAHGEDLAVLKEAKKQDDASKADRRKMVYGMIGTGFGALLALAGEIWHILSR